MKTCDLCGQPVDPESRMTLRSVSGFAGSRGSIGGANTIYDKQWGDEYRHSICNDKKKRGHVFGQAQFGGVA